MFQTTHRAACAGFAVGDEGHMAQFGAAVGKAVEQFAADDHCAADAGSHGQEHYILCALSGSVHRFSQSHQVGVVAHLHGQPRFRFDAVGKIQILPAFDILGSAQHNAVGFVHNAGSAYTYSFHRYSELQGRSHCLFAGGYQLADYRFRRYIGFRRQLPLKVKYAFIVDKGVFHGSTAKVNSYSVFFHDCQTLSAHIGELHAHCPSRWRTRT